MSSNLDCHVEALAANPNDTHAFEALEEGYFLEGAWPQLVDLYDLRLARGGVERAPEREGFVEGYAEGIDVGAPVEMDAVRRDLLETHGIEVGAGLGKLAGRIWRIGLMGENARLATVEALLCAMRRELG